MPSISSLANAPEFARSDETMDTEKVATVAKASIPANNKDISYERLPRGHFRTLQYLGEKAGLYHFSLTTHRMQDAIEYMALSYTWGPPEEEYVTESWFGSGFRDGLKEIVLNGQTVKVRQNLFEFFQHFEQRWPESDQIGHQPIWIDALCINQSDEIEKAEQVDQMDVIYSNAAVVLVWFGREGNHTTRTTEMIQALGAYVLEKSSSGQVLDFGTTGFDRLDILDPGFQRRLGLQEACQKDDWVALFLFFQRNWFSRVWTLPEAILGRLVLCCYGHYTVPYNAVVNASVALFTTALTPAVRSLIPGLELQRQDYVYHAISDTGLKMLSIHEAESTGLLEHFRRQYNIPDLRWCAAAVLDHCLTATAFHRSANPHDKIFGILGVVRRILRSNETDLSAFTADYREPVGELYTRTMAFILSGVGSLTPLARVGNYGLSQSFPLPSWVRDFSSGSPNQLLDMQAKLKPQDATTNPYNASRGSKIGFSIHGPVLQVHHFKLASVTQVSESYNEIKEHWRIERTCGLMVSWAASKPFRSNFVDDIWKTMLCDNNSPGLGECFSDDTLRLAFRGFFMVLQWSRASHIWEQGIWDYTTHILADMEWQEMAAESDISGTIPSPTATMALINEDRDLEIYKAAAEDSEAFQNIANMIMVHRRLFLLDNGCLGLGPDTVRPGDVLCIVPDGVRTPMLIRQANDQESNNWTLVGEAYVRDIMYGEAVERMEEEGKTWEKINLV